MPSIRHNQFHPLLLEYISRALTQMESTAETTEETISFLVRHQRSLGLSFPKSFPKETPYKRKKLNPALTEDEIWSSDIRVKRFERTIAAVKQSLTLIQSSGFTPLRFFDNLDFFAAQAHLDKDDIKLMAFYAATKRVDTIQAPYSRIGSFSYDIIGSIRDDADSDDYYRAISFFLDIPEKTAKTKIRELTSFGLLTENPKDAASKADDRLPLFAYTISNRLFDILMSHETKDNLLDALIGEKAEGHLSASDFDYMRDHAQHLIESVKGAVNSEGKGKNFGVYGVPGVGKTQFMGVLAQETGVSVYFVGAAAKPSTQDLFSATFKEPKRSESFGDLLRASFIAKRLGLKVILVKDEAEGILKINSKENNKEDTANKGAINFFLDHNETPTIFITNDLEELELATQRRLVSWTAFKQPPIIARAAILEAQLQEKDLRLDARFVRHLVEKFPDLTPGVTEKIIQDISRRGDLKTADKDQLKAVIIDQFSEQQLALTGGVHYSILPPRPTEQPYPHLWAADIDLGKFQDQLSRISSGFLVSLVGPIGTGKKSFAYHFAQQQNRYVVEQSGSDIVFGHPKQYAAFSRIAQEAKDNHAVLILSSQDHLADPEILVLDQYFRLIEALEVPTFVTIDANPMANMPHKILNASFETINFNYMNPVQSMLAYHSFFQRPAPPVLQTFKRLTPAVFAHLTSMINKTGTEMSDEELVEKLHRRANEYKASGLIPLDTLIGYSDNPDRDIKDALPIEMRRAGRILVTPRALPLTLPERYDMLKKIPRQQKIQWKDVALLLPEPERHEFSQLRGTIKKNDLH